MLWGGYYIFFEEHFLVDEVVAVGFDLDEFDGVVEGEGLGDLEGVGLEEGNGEGGGGVLLGGFEPVGLGDLGGERGTLMRK